MYTAEWKNGYTALSSKLASVHKKGPKCGWIAKKHRCVVS